MIMLLYVAVSTTYNIFLAFAYFFKKEKTINHCSKINRFCVIVPAHNEEALISELCRSFGAINYPKEYFVIFIIADNCNDNTVEKASKYCVKILERHNHEKIGKGHALAWGLEKVPLEEFDSILIIDADNYVDPEILQVLNDHINAGEKAIQCFNSVGNRDDSWFTQLIYVTRTIGNLLYHESKYRLGLSSYLMGNGICFESKLIRARGWTAFSTGEDWEYYAQLIESGIEISFAAKAKVYHQESRSLNQATSQRLRWSSGRFHIAKTLGVRLFVEGLKKGDLVLLDASLPLILPNYSLLINITLVSIGLALILPSSSVKTLFLSVFVLMLLSQILIFLIGVFMAGSIMRVLIAMLYAPFFLVWKFCIDIISLTGIYKQKEWVRTRRH